MGFYKQVKILMDYNGFTEPEAIKFIQNQDSMRKQLIANEEQQRKDEKEMEDELQSNKDRVRFELKLALTDLRAYQEVNRNDMHVQSAIDRLKLVEQIVWEVTGVL